MFGIARESEYPRFSLETDFDTAAGLSESASKYWEDCPETAKKGGLDRAAGVGGWILVFLDRGIVDGGGIARLRDFVGNTGAWIALAGATGTASEVEGMDGEVWDMVAETDGWATRIGSFGDVCAELAS